MKLNHLITLAPDKGCETLSTGFQHLDRITGGLRIGHLCTVAAPSRMGKTAFAVSLLRNIGDVRLHFDHHAGFRKKTYYDIDKSTHQ